MQGGPDSGFVDKPEGEVMTKVCPRCFHMVREPTGAGALSCPRCLRQGNAVPLLNAIPPQRPVVNRGPAATR